MKKTNAIRLLQKQKIDFDLVEYTYDSENLSVEQIAKDNDLELKQVYKTLVMKGDRTGVLVALVAGNASVSLKKMASLSGNKKIAMVAVKDLQKTTGYIRGGCSPLGMKKSFPVFISNEAQFMPKIYVNAGIRGCLVGVNPKQLAELVDSEWSDFVEE